MVTAARNLILMGILVSSAWAYGFGSQSGKYIKRAAEKELCDQQRNSQVEHFSDINNFHNVNIEGPTDDRQFIDDFKFGPEVKDPDKLKKRIRKATGRIRCGDAPNPLGSAFLISYHKQIFACTSNHTFYKRNSGFYNGGEACGFLNQDSESFQKMGGRPADLDLSPDRFILPTRDHRANEHLDLACARFRNPRDLPKDVRASAFVVTGPSRCPSPGQKIYVSSYIEVDKADRGGNDPILREAVVRDLVPRGESKCGAYAFQGDVGRAASGGLNFIVEGDQVVILGATSQTVTLDSARNADYNFQQPAPGESIYDAANRIQVPSFSASTSFSEYITRHLDAMVDGRPQLSQQQGDQTQSEL